MNNGVLIQNSAGDTLITTEDQALLWREGSINPIDTGDTASTWGRQRHQLAQSYPTDMPHIHITPINMRDIGAAVPEKSDFYNGTSPYTQYTLFTHLHKPLYHFYTSILTPTKNAAGLLDSYGIALYDEAGSLTFFSAGRQLMYHNSYSQVVSSGGVATFDMGRNFTNPPIIIRNYANAWRDFDVNLGSPYGVTRFRWAPTVGIFSTGGGSYNQLQLGNELSTSPSIPLNKYPTVSDLLLTADVYYIP